ncbi:M23 family metallopeptidase [Brevibacterium permense]|uniref:M23 family metallopeptidase n=1 Tax=Brevibacterium permense TaxID=234834 RepID=UPI0021CE3D1C|nr:M23 family metallopeptidase [Brevibacterium permense]
MHRGLASFRSTALGVRRPSPSVPLLRPESPANFVGFGCPVLSPVAGTVAASHDTERDHLSYRGVPSIGYSLTQARRVRSAWLALAGNHVMIRCVGGVVALCHLQHLSSRVRAGQHIEIGDEIGRCGNSGNSTEPHLHVQATDRVDIDDAVAARIAFRGVLPSNGSIISGGTLE